MDGVRATTPAFVAESMRLRALRLADKVKQPRRARVTERGLAHATKSEVARFREAERVEREQAVEIGREHDARIARSRPQADAESRVQAEKDYETVRKRALWAWRSRGDLPAEWFDEFFARVVALVYERDCKGGGVESISAYADLKCREVLFDLRKERDVARRCDEYIDDPESIDDKRGAPPPREAPRVVLDDSYEVDLWDAKDGGKKFWRAVRAVNAAKLLATLVGVGDEPGQRSDLVVARHPSLLDEDGSFDPWKLGDSWPQYLAPDIVLPEAKKNTAFVEAWRVPSFLGLRPMADGSVRMLSPVELTWLALAAGYQPTNLKVRHEFNRKGEREVTAVGDAFRAAYPTIKAIDRRITEKIRDRAGCSQIRAAVRAKESRRGDEAQQADVTPSFFSTSEMHHDGSRNRSGAAPSRDPQDRRRCRR